MTQPPLTVKEFTETWSRLVKPLLEGACEAEREAGTPALATAMAMIAAGAQLLTDAHGPGLALGCLQAAIENLEKNHGDELARLEARDGTLQ